MAWRETILRRLHLCLGAFLAVPLVTIGLTGSVLVFESELRAWMEPVPKATGAGPAHKLAEIIAAAHEAAPGLVPTLVAPSQAAGGPASVRLAEPARRPGPGGITVFVDPATLAILGAERPGDTLLRQIFLLHANLLRQDRSGRDIVGWFGVAMCALGLSGLVLWWPAQRQWRGAFTMRQGTRGAPLLRQIHGATGIWSLAVFLVVSFSGVWLAFPQSFNGVAASWFGLRDVRPGLGVGLAKPQPGIAPLDADGAAALAEASVPGARLRSLNLPMRADQPFRAVMRRAHSAGALPIIALVDPWQRRVVGLRDPSAYSPAERLVASMHAIHDGSAFGWAWRALVFLSGLLPAIFATSGIWMWVLKSRSRRRRRAAAAWAPGE
ncbi:MAG: PepSY-associated TM helix domain-containing protein [Stellaceae bacterium]